MADPQLALDSVVSEAMERAFGPVSGGADPVVRPAGSPRFGDFQANGALALAKRLGRAPRDVAEAIVSELDAREMCSAVEVAGAGFINLTLRDEWIADQVGLVLSDKRLGVRRTEHGEAVVVDYSGPNAAKEMHVGHLRSTVIGDALARVMDFVGHRVTRQNHVGDWGTQFGMLIEYLREQGWGPGADHVIGDLNALYQVAHARFQSDPEFARRAQQRVVSLQGGDAPTLELWRELVAESERHFSLLYARMGVLLTPSDIRGESFYNDQLGDVVSELERAGLVRTDDGAICAFPEGFLGRDGNPLPLIVRKADGGYLYATTDLAALRFRARTLAADRIVYVVDARQSQHLAMVFAVAAQAGWLDEHRRAEHVSFGMVQGEDGRPFRTRSGETVKLADLLDEAISRASSIIIDKNPELADPERATVASAVGIGAIKYADLSSDRVKDYVFDWDRMLTFEGNTGAYLQNAYVRVRSILRRATNQEPGAIVLAEPQERALALGLLRFDGAVHAVADVLAPHRLCTYLFELAQTFTAFYESCPVLRAETPALLGSRLALCEATALILQLGLGLLGIQTVERM